MASITGKLKDLDSWVRNRLRYCIWTDWKKPERKRKNLIRLGVDQQHAYAWSRTRMGGWAVAQSPIMITTITLERLHKRGYEAMLDYYSEKYSSLSRYDKFLITMIKKELTLGLYFATVYSRLRNKKWGIFPNEDYDVCS